MKLPDIYAILGRIARTFPFNDNDRDINSFAVIAAQSDLSVSNVNTLEVGTDKRLSWSREWAANGYIPGEFKADQRTLAIMLNGATIPKKRGDNTCYKLTVTITAPLKCSNCQDGENNDVPYLDTINVETMTAILHEFSTYALYTGITVNGQLGNYFLSSAEYKALFPNNNLACPAKQFHSVTWGEGFPYTDTGLERRYLDVDLTVCVCDSEQTQFNYAVTDGDPAGVVRCSCC